MWSTINCNDSVYLQRHISGVHDQCFNKIDVLVVFLNDSCINTSGVNLSSNTKMKLARDRGSNGKGQITGSNGNI